MANSTPYWIRIFVVDGDPDGLRHVERSDWMGKGVMFPRAIFPAVRKQEEFQQIGVYLLLGPRPDGEGEMIYIGEGDPVGPRFEGHHANKGFWTRAVFFVAGEKLNKAHIQYLEAKLVFLAEAAKRMQLENSTRPAEPTMSTADRAGMDAFLDNILGILPLLGIHAFETSPTVSLKGGAIILSCEGRGVTASGCDTPQGFVVQAGSLAAADEVPSLKSLPNVSQLRSDLTKSGVLTSENGKLRFTQDYTFSSPSLAAAVVLGCPSNGRKEWKDPDGRTLKEIQESQAVE